VELHSTEDVENINPRFDRMLDLPGRGVIVTAPAAASSEYDFTSRFFCPSMGIKEVLSVSVSVEHMANILVCYFES
jgi:predicted PhzF superfamily epimerase YddE/YHI9